MTATDYKIARMRELPQDALGVFLDNRECAWLLNAAEALNDLMAHLDVDPETMTVWLGRKRVAYFPEDATVIDGALVALAATAPTSEATA